MSFHPHHNIGILSRRGDCVSVGPTPEPGLRMDDCQDACLTTESRLP